MPKIRQLSFLKRGLFIGQWVAIAYLASSCQFWQYSNLKAVQTKQTQSAYANSLLQTAQVSFACIAATYNRLLLSQHWDAPYLFACLILFSRQQYFIFKPTRTIQKSPDFYNLDYQDVWLPVKTSSSKVERMHGWWIPATRAELGTLLYLHGNGLNIGANINQAYRFQQMGFSVLLIDYRGYGKSEGSFPTESKIYEDAETAWNYLVKERKVPAREIFLYGHSLGGAIAIELAVRHPEAAGAIVQSSFTSLQNMAERYSLARLFPVRLLLTQRFDSIVKIKSLRVPVLFVHGTADPYIPATMSQTLYDSAPQPKQLLLVPNAKHNNGDAFFNEISYSQFIRTFVEKARKK